MWYIIGQVLVCMLLTAALGALAGWLARGYHARAELTSLQQQLQRQARDLRNRGAAAPLKSSVDTDGRAQQQLRHQLVRLQSQVEQRDKEIAYLRQVIGDQRPFPAKQDGAASGGPENPSRQRTPGT